MAKKEKTDIIKVPVYTTEITESPNDIWSFHLVLLVIALTLFTLLYSFILSKK